ncbi:hypothetical protein HWV62_22806 [Athelia sp. TMB]|nr:hypothetical protein HWV62_22806 [Athelia sp. TMB]
MATGFFNTFLGQTKVADAPSGTQTGWFTGWFSGKRQLHLSQEPPARHDAADRSPKDREDLRNPEVAEDNAVANMRQELERMRCALVDAERRMEEWKSKEKAGRDYTREIEGRLDKTKRRLEAKEDALKECDARLEDSHHAYNNLAAQSRSRTAALEETIRQRDQDARVTRAEMADVKTRLESASKLLESRTQELKGAQPFLTKTDTLSGADIIALVQSLNTDIFQLSAYMADSFPMSESVLLDGGDHMAVHENAQLHVGMRLKDALVTLAHAEDPTILQTALQCCLARVSSRLITNWTVDNSFCDMDVLYERVRDQESQAVAGRWRALTRRHLHDMSAEGKDLVPLVRSHICDGLTDILLSAKCQRSRPDIENDLNKFGDRIEAIINASLYLKHVLGEQVTSSDLKIISVEGGESFDPTCMDDAEGPGGEVPLPEVKEIVLCTTELGLRREAKVDKGDQSTVDIQILLKPMVALETQVFSRDL